MKRIALVRVRVVDGDPYSVASRRINSVMAILGDKLDHRSIVSGGEADRYGDLARESSARTRSDLIVWKPLTLVNSARHNSNCSLYGGYSF